MLFVHTHNDQIKLLTIVHVHVYMSALQSIEHCVLVLSNHNCIHYHLDQSQMSVTLIVRYLTICDGPTLVRTH